MSQPVEWSTRVAEVVGGEVRRWRERRGLSTQGLADAVANLGLEIKRPVLSNLENQRRATVSVAELLVLAAALEVTPSLLIFPVGQTNGMEPLPGVTASPTAALRWAFEGDPLPGVPAAHDGARVQLFARHHQTMAAWEATRTRLSVVETDGEREELLDRAARFERDLKQYREVMQRNGLVLPPLPAGLAGLDEGPWPTRGLPSRGDEWWPRADLHAWMVATLEKRLTDRAEAREAADAADDLRPNHEHAVEWADRSILRQGDQLAHLRALMRAEGATPPQLPDYLARFDGVPAGGEQK